MATKELESPFKLRTLEVDGQKYVYYSLEGLEIDEVAELPFSIKVLLEAAMRQFDGKYIKYKHVDQLVQWKEKQWESKEVPFKPSRIVFQDYTGIPALVDLAAMRNAIQKTGGDVANVNPQIPVDLVIDHSMNVDESGHEGSFEANLQREFERNSERYRFVRWAQKAFKNFRAVPPGSGIVHQVNLEYLSNAIMTEKHGDSMLVYPDSVVGTDSHTPMINGLGVVGWGVGGIEAESVMLGQPLSFVIPQVVGVELKGALPEGTTATDLTLTITNILRKKGVVGKFVEFFGTGLKHISLADRATIANMAPEYGATMGFFPTDEVTIDYLRTTGRGHVAPLAEAYYKAQGLFRTDRTATPAFTEIVEIDLGTIRPSLAGPKRPQDRVELANMKQGFADIISQPVADRGYGLNKEELNKAVGIDEAGTKLTTGAVVLASITSCTNTSNPYVMLAAGLVAKKAVEKGLQVPSYVKTSLTPGSKIVSHYLQQSGLLPSLEQLGFYVDGYGCAVCCGNSGPLSEEVEKAIKDNDLIVASVLSGNRNFEGRIHPLIKANYLGSPPLVIAYALAGTVQKDLTTEPLGTDQNGDPVYLKDIWPTSHEIQALIAETINAELFESQYETIFENKNWSAIEAPEGLIYEWDKDSTYIQEAPFFEDAAKAGEHAKAEGLSNMKVLLQLGDSITTDHISPAGQIGVQTPAGKFLRESGVAPDDFNSYGSRRGNHHVMMRGTFANIRIRNKLVEGTEGGYTKYLPTGEIMSVYDAAMKYKDDNQNLLVIAGKEYGTGSSRDWAAKGTALLGVKAVLAESFERIHRSNLVGMGVLPLQFVDGENAENLNINGTEAFDIIGLDKNIEPGQFVTIKALSEDGSAVQFKAKVRLDSVVEVESYLDGGILQTVLKQIK